ncbi:hypothetical protein NECAME_17850, partial [Necator americanus]
MPLLLMLAFCRSGNFLEVPSCPENDEFALNSTIREQFYKRILKQKPSLEYGCDLELMGGLALDDPNKNMEFLKSKKVLTYY